MSGVIESKTNKGGKIVVVTEENEKDFPNQFIN